MTTLLLSPFDKSIFWHGAESYVILGFLGVLLGLLVGWLAWRRCKDQADHLERANEELRHINQLLEEKQGAINSIVEEI